MTRGPSPHLAWHELTSGDGVLYPPRWRDRPRIKRLAELFEAIRSVCGCPLIINSAYRTRDWNAHVGGRKRSQHLAGRALDIARPRHMTRRDFHRAVLSACRANQHCGGLGGYDNFVHVDVRPSKDGRIVIWGSWDLR